MDSEKILIARIDERVKNIDEKLDKLVEHVEKQNNRIAKIETWKAEMKGGVAVITVAISFVITIVSILVAKLFGF